jgi:DNA-binding MarR family transcriptional regulator
MSRRRASDSVDKTLDAFRLDNNVSHLLRRAHFRAEGLFVANLQDSGLTPRQKALLIASFQHPGSTLSNLAEQIVLDRQTTAEMAQRLVARGLLEQRRSANDRRAYAMWVTPSGVDLLRLVMPRDAEVQEAILAPLPLEYRPLFLKCLHLMTTRETGGETGES